MPLIETGAAIARALGIPAKNEDPQPWRLKMFLAVMALSILFGLHFAAAKGFLGFIGIDGVAYAGEMRNVQDTHKAILRAIYAPQIRLHIRERCETTVANEREKINKDLDRLLAEYREATGEAFKPIPRCDEV